MSSDVEKPTEQFSVQEVLAIVETQREREKADIRAHCLSAWSGNGNLDAACLKRFAWSGAFARQLLGEHPFAPIYDSVDEIATAFRILKAARDMIVDEYGIFHSDIAYSNFKRHEYFSHKLTQDIFQFVFASEALVQAYRRLIGKAPQYKERYEALRSQVFCEPGLQDFIKKLRNCYGHQEIILAEPRGSIRRDEEEVITSSIEFDKDRLLRMRDVWNKQSRTFIKSQKKS